MKSTLETSYNTLKTQHLSHLPPMPMSQYLSRFPPTPIFIFLCWPRIDQMISVLQQELVDINALKSGVRWREKGEKSAKYLRAIHQKRKNQQLTEP